MHDRSGTGVGLAAASALLVVVALALSKGGAAPAARFAGIGTTVTEEQPLTEGWYDVAWTATTGGRPAKACLIGLRLDQTLDETSRGPQEYPTFMYRVPKLVYRTLPARGRLSGSSGPLRLEAGRYRMIADGWCEWSVSILASDPGSSPSRSGGPRM